MDQMMMNSQAYAGMAQHQAPVTHGMYGIEHGMIITALILFGAAILLFAEYSMLRKKMLNSLGNFMFFMGAVFCLLALIIRWISGGIVPITNVYETMIFTAMCIALFQIFFAKKFSLPDSNMISAIVAAFCLFSCLQFDRIASAGYEIHNLKPALASYWLPIHVLITMVSYGFFVLAFSGGVVYLVSHFMGSDAKDSDELKLLPNNADKFTYKAVMYGFLFLGAGIITGSVWANEAWGVYWAWDPKEIWSLIIWVFYLLYFHARFSKYFGKTTAAILAVVGILLVTFTYVGVSYLKLFSSSEHSFS